MIKRIIVFLLILNPVLLLSQNKKSKKNITGINTTIPVQSQYSNKFKIVDVYFNKRIDFKGRGEVLEVELNIKNMTDEPLDLYVFVIATFEKKQPKNSSFLPPIPQKDRIRSFVPYPFDLKNFQYPDVDDRGVVKKDQNGREKTRYLKFPRNPKAGINPFTGKPYHIKYKKLIRTTHLSKYRNNFFFFNEVAILIFDKQGKPAFRQLYELTSYRK